MRCFVRPLLGAIAFRNGASGVDCVNEVLTCCPDDGAGVGVRMAPLVQNGGDQRIQV